LVKIRKKERSFYGRLRRSIRCLSENCRGFLPSAKILYLELKMRQIETRPLSHASQRQAAALKYKNTTYIEQECNDDQNKVRQSGR